MPVFVGERYIHGANQGTAYAEAERLRDAVRSLPPGRPPLKLVSTTFVPNEEWAFDLFEAETAEDVQRVYSDCALTVERVTEGVHLPGP